MSFRFAIERDDYSDFAAGPVFYSLPGRPAFPVRLASEIFQRCQAHLARAGRGGPYTLYDPCCGSAYTLATLAYLHWPLIGRLLASDADPDVLPLAERNLSLVTRDGVEQRIAQLARLYQQFVKPSHAQALASAERLRARLLDFSHQHSIPSRVFIANALDAASLQPHLDHEAIDLIMTDLPYGQRSAWIERDPSPGAPDPGWRLLEALRAVALPTTLVVLTSTKQQRAAHEAYERLEQWQIGKRRTLFFRLK